MCNLKMMRHLLLAGVVGISSLLAGCGGGGAGGNNDNDDDPVTSTAAKVSLATSGISVDSDNSESVTITATVQDASNLVLAGQNVQFSTSTGQLVASSTLTDSNGNVSATFQSGAIDLTNRTAIIEATVVGSTTTGSIPIQITGSTLSSASDNTTVVEDVAEVLRATALIANAKPAVNQMVRFTIAGSSLGSGGFGAGMVSSITQQTNNNGVAEVSFTGSGAGQVDVLIEWLDSENAPSISRIHSFSVQSSGAAFEITTPTNSPWPVELNANQTVTASTPGSVNGTAVDRIRFSTTLGGWNGGGSKTVTVARTSDTSTQTFNAGGAAGNATIQVDALSVSGSVLATSKRIFALSATADTANSINLQSSVTVLAPSSGGTASTAELSARVLDAGNNAVAGASVLFELVNPTGNGEQIDPVVVSTNSSGYAISTFTAGTSSTLQSSTIRASVIGSPIPSSDITITVGGTAGSVAIGTSTTISSVNSDTSYSLPVTVMVTDSNGNAVSGVTVSLSIWGKRYFKGTRPKVDDICPADVDSVFLNEDVNENLLLEPGEDLDGPGNRFGFGLPDGDLWPPSSAAGSIPSTVITSSDGTATFNWIYLKQYADWVEARIRATVQALGTEATTTSTQILAPSKVDVEACVLPASPFN